MKKNKFIWIAIGSSVIGIVLLHILRPAYGLNAIDPERYNDNPKLKDFAKQFKIINTSTNINACFRSCAYDFDKIKDTRAIDILFEGLNEKHLIINKNFFNEISLKNKPSSTVYHFPHIMTDTASNLRMLLIRKLGDPKTIQKMTQKQKETLYKKLIYILKRSDYFYERAYAARALGNLGDKRAFPLILDIFKNAKTDRMRGAAAYAVGKLGGKQGITILTNALKTQKKLKPNIIIALGLMDNKLGVPPLITVLKNDKLHLARYYAALTLGETGDKRAVKPLINALQNDMFLPVRQQAASALGKLQDTSAVIPLINALNKKGLRYYAICALGRLNDKRATVPIINSIKNETNDSIRMEAIEALGQLNDKRATIPLINLLKKETNDNIRNKIIEALGKLNDERAVTPLINILNENNIRTINSTKNALKMLDKNGIKLPEKIKKRINTLF